MNNMIFKIFILLTCLFYSSYGFSQTTKNKSPYPAKYINLTDDALVIKTITLAPVYDNSNGIYKTAAEKHLKELMVADKSWGFKELQPDSPRIKIDEFEESSQDTEQFLKKNQVDGVFTLFIIKGPQGMSLQLNLFSKDKGLLLLSEDYSDEKLFEIVKIKDVLTKMYFNLKAKLPYSGFVTSRTGNKVTVNIGSQKGLKIGDQITVAQILKVNRHPKLKMLTSVEKEILGRVQINEVQEETSYGEIVLEKETGVIDRGAKILPLEFVKYTPSQGAPVTDILPLEKNPVEWLPAPTPQFGRMTLLGGLSEATANTVLNNGRSLDANSKTALSFNFETELWLTPDIFGQIDFSQINFTGNNELSGSSPSKLSFTINDLDFNLGYKYLIDGSFWGPQIYSALGYKTFSTRVSDSSPTAFTSSELTAYSLNLGGVFPVTEKNDVSIGAQAQFLFFKSLSETPVNSGSSSPEYSQFDLWGTYQYTNNIHLKALLSLKNLQSSMSGQGSKNPASRSFDEKITSYLFGIDYLF